MRHLARLVRQFCSDERGVFAVIFGVSAIVLIALAGSVVDFVSMQQARNRAQVALDAATLALQPEIFEDDLTEDDIRQRAEDLVVERLADSSIETDIDTITVDVESGSLYLEGELSIPTVFVALVGFEEFTIRIFAEATRKNLALEVVMVLDNSGSMVNFRRMDYLKEAAECATNILFYDDCTPPGGAVGSDDVRIGIVPFTTMVNVGTQYADEDWIDRTGAADKTRDNFDDDDNEDSEFRGNVDRLQLFDQLNNVSWKGCMEARVYPYSVNDEEPIESEPDTLFTPAFAPDEPDTGGNWYQPGYRNSYIDDEASACLATGQCSCTTTTQRVCERDWRGRETCRNETRRNCTLTVNGRSHDENVCTCGSQPSNTTRNCEVPVSVLPFLSDRERQERICKYSGNIRSTTEGGPNAGCPDASILALSEDSNSILDAIDDMEAEGGTNIHQGAIWGYRALSPTAPFEEGVGYGEDATSKVMILMTDGENTFYPWDNMNNARFNQAYGFPYNEREGDSDSSDRDMERRMDQLLRETCTNAKDDGIAIYTIGLATDGVTQSTPQAVRQLLTDCASGAGNAYFPDDPDELVDVFVAIAGQLAQLRLAQ